jgi:hypothetical protein
VWLALGLSFVLSLFSVQARTSHEEFQSIGIGSGLVSSCAWFGLDATAGSVRGAGQCDDLNDA